jgi:hypothetical protein
LHLRQQTLFIVSLLLKALKQNKPQPERPAMAPLARSPVPTLALVEAEDPFEPPQLDPKELIFDETAWIEPFEPFEATASEFLAADALPEFHEASAEESDSPVEAESEATTTGEIDSRHGEITKPSIDADADENISSALTRLEELQRLIARDREEAADKNDSAKAIEVAPSEAKPATIPPLREEYRELRDHLLARFPLQKPATLLVVDAGRAVCDAWWLMPVAVGIAQHIGEKSNRGANILIVEAAGPDCGLARGLALECAGGLTELITDGMPLEAALTPTEHPQIQLLARGNGALNGDHRQRMAEIWPELQRRFDLILVAAGSLHDKAINSRGSMTTADLLLPLADGILLAIELSGTPQEVAQETQRRLAAHSAKLIGCVVQGDAA